MADWQLTDAPDPADADVVAQGVWTLGRALAKDGHARDLACFVREAGQVVAGATGRTEFDRLFVSFLWVEAARRGRGLGRQVLGAMEAEAIRRGCHSATLETLSDETAGLYRALGYHAIATVKAQVGPFDRHILFKRLRGLSLDEVAGSHADLATRGSGTPVHLRPAVAADAERVADLLVDTRRAFMPYAPSAHREDDVRAWVAGRLVPAGGVVVAVARQRVVGMMATTCQGEVAWIEQMAVEPARVGQGIGARLLAHAMRALPRPTRLWTFQQNAGARRFYERHGFAPIRFTDGRDNEERCPDVLYELTADVRRG